MRELRLALRTVAKSPGFLTLAVSTFALGVGAATVLFSVTESVLWRPFPFVHSDRLVVIQERNLRRPGGGGSVSALNFADWRSRIQSIEGLSAMTWGESRNLTGQGMGERVRVKQVSAGFLETLGVQPAFGRTFRLEDERGTANAPVLLSYPLWQSRFAGSRDVVGQVVKLNGELRTVAGVLPASFHLEFTDDAAVYEPLVTAVPQARRDLRELAVIGRLKPGRSLAQAGAELAGVAGQLASAWPEADGGWGATIENLREGFTRYYRRDLFLYLGFAGFVLAIACANVAALLLVRSVGRQKEFALRTALGASRRNLFRLALAETAWIAVPGGILGSILAAWGVAGIRAVLPAGKLLREETIAMDLTALAFVLAVSLVSALAFALAPAALASRLNLESALRDGGKSVSASRGIARRIDGLIVAEITLAFLLLFAAGLFVSSESRLHQVDLGFDPHEVLTMRVSTGLGPNADAAEVRAAQRQVLQKARGTPGVQQAALAADLPVLSASGVHFRVAGRPQSAHGEEPYSLVRPVSPEFFAVMGMALLQGRAFTEGDSEHAPRVAIINQNLARSLFGGENPIGHQLEILPGHSSIPPGPVEIVGLVPNIKEVDLNEIEFNDIYCPMAQNPARAFYAAVKTPAAERLGPVLRNEVQSLVPDGSVYDVSTMEERIDRSLAGARFNLSLVSFFAGLAVLLAAVGVYGAISFSAAQRTREFGLRIALGAGKRAIISITLVRSGRLALAGAISGLGLALILGSTLKGALYLAPGQHGGVLYGVGIHDPVILAGAASMMLALGGLAALAPAYRASRVEPLEALRHDG